MIESSSVRRALSLVRDEISPTRDDKARLRARIVAPAALVAGASAEGTGAQGSSASRAAKDAVASVVSGAAPVASLGRWAALKAAGAAGATALITGGLALLGVGGGVGFWLGQEAGLARARSVAAIEAPVQAPAASVLAPVPSVAPAVAEVAHAEGASDAVTPPSVSEPRRADVAPRAHAKPRPQPSPINDELALLRRVERALRNNDPALARALLGELDERFPDSRLGEERAAARRIADCRSGEPDAIASARAFLREHGASVYRQRIVRACALDAEAKEKSAVPRSGAAPMTNAEGADTHVR